MSACIKWSVGDDLYGSKEQKDGELHDCAATVEQILTPRPVLQAQPLTKPDLILFLDGSAKRDPDTGTPQVGYAVVMQHTYLQSAHLPGYLSAQATELFTLTHDCILAQDRSATIYTDNRYAFRVAYDFGALWKNRAFFTSTGKSITHASLVNNLLEAILLPKQIAVCKCAAHTSADDPVTQGNNRADAADKTAAGSLAAPILQMRLLEEEAELPHTPLTSLTECQAQATPAEKRTWAKAGTKTIGTGLVVSPAYQKHSKAPYFARVTHGKDHVSKVEMAATIQQH